MIENQIMIPRKVLDALKTKLFELISSYYLSNNDAGIDKEGKQLHYIGTNNLEQIEGSDPPKYKFKKGIKPTLIMERTLLMFNCMNEIIVTNVIENQVESIGEQVAKEFIEKLENILREVGLVHNHLSQTQNKYSQFYHQGQQELLLKSNVIPVLNLAIAYIIKVRNSYGLGETTAYANIAITPPKRSCSIM